MAEFVEVKTAELVGPALDWAVAQAEGIEYHHKYVWQEWSLKTIDPSNAHLIKSNFSPSTRPGECVPLVGKYKVSTTPGYTDGVPVRGWFAVAGDSGLPPAATAFSPSWKVAVCRAIAIQKFGARVGVPAYLVQDAAKFLATELPGAAQGTIKALAEQTGARLKAVAEQIGATLAEESGGGFGFVCIWRKSGDPLDDGADHARRCSVGEFLSRPENQRGTWLIDGGWGGPPGPIHVRWDEGKQEWESGGYCGRMFQKTGSDHV